MRNRRRGIDEEEVKCEDLTFEKNKEKKENKGDTRE